MMQDPDRVQRTTLSQLSPDRRQIPLASAALWELLKLIELHPPGFEGHMGSASREAMRSSRAMSC